MIPSTSNDNLVRGISIYGKGAILSRKTTYFPVQYYKLYYGVILSDLLTVVISGDADLSAFYAYQERCKGYESRPFTGPRGHVIWPPIT